MDASEDLSQRALLGLREAQHRREEKLLRAEAAFSRDALRRHAEQRLDSSYRLGYSVDVDRILHSRAYARYIDKTQVFSLVSHDHITHRVLHVQLVSKIGRTIGRFLRLNEDLIEAIALGHDIGHPPFGHEGENILSRLCQRAGIGRFLHNVQSVHFMERVENRGQGWNLGLQTLDGMLCHNGEIHRHRLTPEPDKSFESLSAAMDSMVRGENRVGAPPMTLEGCVVHLADTIAYIGRDIEDAIRMGLIRREDIPRSCVDVLGSTNGTIVYQLVTDLIMASEDRPYVGFSAPVGEALRALKAFNYERIYMNPKIREHLSVVADVYDALFHETVADIDAQRRDKTIYTTFLENMPDAYSEGLRPAEIARDFIAGMTDRFFIRLAPARAGERLRRLASTDTGSGAP